MLVAAHHLLKDSTCSLFGAAASRGAQHGAMSSSAVLQPYLSSTLDADPEHASEPDVKFAAAAA
jgi:hypothetical protein